MHSGSVFGVCMLILSLSFFPEIPSDTILIIATVLVHSAAQVLMVMLLAEALYCRLLRLSRNPCLCFAMKKTPANQSDTHALFFALPEASLKVKQKHILIGAKPTM